MGPPITLRILGLPIHTRLTTPVALAVVLFGVASAADREPSTELAVGAAALLGIIGALCLHEIVRIYLFRRHGVVVRELAVSLTGGSPRLIDRTDSPQREVIAASGGLIVIALLAASAVAVAHLALPPATHDLAELVAIALAAIAVTQTLPALSLDGGRLIRGLFWFLTDDPVRGARGAALYGHFVSAAMIVSGLMLMGRSGALPYWGFGAVVAGLQLIAASTASLRDSVWQQLGGTLTLVDADLPLPARIRAETTLETVGLAAKADWLAGRLSHGEKQWLEIGMVIAQDPELLLVDEPVAGMTDEETASTGELLQSIAADRSVLVIEHDMEFVRQIARKVTVLHQGTVLCEGPVDQVQSDPRVLEVYLGQRKEVHARG